MQSKLNLKRRQGIFWSRDIKNLSLNDDKNYIIHQTLMYGDLNDFKWLKSVYPLAEIKNVFQHSPAKIYTPSALNFVARILLDLKNYNPQKYLKFAPRNT